MTVMRLSPWQRRRNPTCPSCSHRTRLEQRLTAYAWRCAWGHQFAARDVVR